MIKEVKVDKSSCIGCGSCVDASPEFFEISPQGISRVVKNSLPDPSSVGDNAQEKVFKESSLLRAAQACPVRAISLFDEYGAKIYPKN